MSRYNLLIACCLTLGLLLVQPQTAAAQTITTVDSGIDSVGQYTSLVLDGNGNPVISYFDDTIDALKLARCNTPDCSGTPDITTVDSAGSVGWYTSLVLDSSGNPVISYSDFTDLLSLDLKLAHCNTPDCSGTPDITTVDSAGSVGSDTSLVLDVSGNPVISYWDSTNDALKLARCNTPDCSGTPTLTTVDDGGVGGDVGWYTSLALNASGNPVISYWDNTNDALKLAYCNTPDCSGTPTLTTVDDGGVAGDVVGLFTSLVLDSSGNPVISYFDFTNSDLKLARCSTPTCSGTPTLTTVDSSEEVGRYTSLALNASGNPVISYSYSDASNNALKLARCNTPDCSGTPTLTTVDSGGEVRQHTSLVLDVSGNPVISYFDVTNNALKLATFSKDINGDGKVTPTDAVFVVNRLGNTPIGADAPADVDGDNDIDVDDLTAVIAAIGG